MPCTRGIRRPGADGQWAEQVTARRLRNNPKAWTAWSLSEEAARTGERREKSAARCPEACIDTDASLAAPQALRKAAAAAPPRGPALFPRAAPEELGEVGGSTKPSAAPQRGRATAPRAAPGGREREGGATGPAAVPLRARQGLLEMHRRPRRMVGGAVERAAAPPRGRGR